MPIVQEDLSFKEGEQITMSRLIKTGTGTRLKDDSWLTMILVQSIAATMFILICQASAFGQMGSYRPIQTHGLATTVRTLAPE